MVGDISNLILILLYLAGLLLAFPMHTQFRIFQRCGQSLFTQFEDSLVQLSLFHDSLPFSIISGFWLYSLISQNIKTVDFLSEYQNFSHSSLSQIHRDRKNTQYYFHFSSDNFFSESACLISSPEPSRYCFQYFVQSLQLLLAEGHQHFFYGIMKYWQGMTFFK